MKRLISIFLISLYALTSIGVTSYINTCHGSVTDISFNNKAESCCENSTNTESHSCYKTISCCNQEFVYLKLDNNSQRPSQNLSFIYIPNSVNYTFVFESKPQIIKTYTVFNYAEIPKPKTFLKNCQLIFYS